MNNEPALENGVAASLADGLLGAAAALRDRLEAAVEPHGVSLPKLDVLSTLVTAGEALPLGVLTQRLECAKSNVTQLMDRLEADKLVRRVPDPHDRRSVLAEITEAGRQRCEAGMRAVAAARAEFLGQLPADERERLAKMLAQFDEHRGT